jgi:hypothetical protein
MSEQRYQVIAECAYVKIADASGVSWRLLEKGALIFGDTPNLEHLLKNGYVAKVGGEATGGVDADGVPSGARQVEVPAGLTTTPVEVVESDEQKQAKAKAKADADTAEKRAAAQAKLAELGGKAPDGRASQAVWAEYLVSTGSKYEDVANVDKADLVKLHEQRTQS